MPASALHDAHRAILVGQKTAGAVASSELLPLPGGGGLQIAVAAATAAESGAALDGVGVVPDVVFPTAVDQRTDLGTPNRVDVYYGMADRCIGVAQIEIAQVAEQALCAAA